MVALSVAFSMLLIAGIEHARHSRVLVRVLETHAVWPSWGSRLIGTGLPIVECGLGGFGLILTLSTSGELLTAVVIAAGAVYGAFATYSIFLLARRASVPCGCDGRGGLMTRAVALRAMGLSVACFASAAWPMVSPLDAVLSEWTTVFLSGVASLSLGLTIWSLPSALENRARVTV